MPERVQPPRNEREAGPPSLRSVRPDVAWCGAGKVDQVHWGCRGLGGHWVGGPGTASFQGARGWAPDCGGFMKCGRWKEEAADVGHLFWKFGSKEGGRKWPKLLGREKGSWFLI